MAEQNRKTLSEAILTDVLYKEGKLRFNTHKNIPDISCNYILTNPKDNNPKNNNPKDLFNCLSTTFFSKKEGFFDKGEYYYYGLRQSVNNMEQYLGGDWILRIYTDGSLDTLLDNSIIYKGVLEMARLKNVQICFLSCPTYRNKNNNTNKFHTSLFMAVSRYFALGDTQFNYIISRNCRNPITSIDANFVKKWMMTDKDLIIYAHNKYNNIANQLEGRKHVNKIIYLDEKLVTNDMFTPNVKLVNASMWGGKVDSQLGKKLIENIYNYIFTDEYYKSLQWDFGTDEALLFDALYETLYSDDKPLLTYVGKDIYTVAIHYMDPNIVLHNRYMISFVRDIRNHVNIHYEDAEKIKELNNQINLFSSIMELIMLEKRVYGESNQMYQYMDLMTNIVVNRGPQRDHAVITKQFQLFYMLGHAWILLKASYLGDDQLEYLNKHLDTIDIMKNNHPDILIETIEDLYWMSYYYILKLIKPKQSFLSMIWFDGVKFVVPDNMKHLYNELLGGDATYTMSEVVTELKLNTDNNFTLSELKKLSEKLNNKNNNSFMYIPSDEILSKIPLQENVNVFLKNDMMRYMHQNGYDQIDKKKLENLLDLLFMFCFTEQMIKNNIKNAREGVKELIKNVSRMLYFYIDIIEYLEDDIQSGGKSKRNDKNEKILKKKFKTKSKTKNKKQEKVKNIKPNRKQIRSKKRL
jgi:hypothetical protein